MFESVVLTVLNQLLGKYLDNLEYDQLKIGIFNGEVLLNGLRLRSDALVRLGLPITVVHGHLGQLELRIPWTSLKSKPVEVIVSDLFMVGVPLDSGAANEAEQLELAHQSKMESVETSELFDFDTVDAQFNERIKSETFVSQLTNQIINNVRITVKNIHLRYEDDSTHPLRSFAIGFTLHSLSSISVDEKGESIFHTTLGSVLRKKAMLDSIVVYSQPELEAWRKLSLADFIEVARSTIPRADNPQSINADSFILGPISSAANLVINRGSPDLSFAQALALDFDNLTLRVGDEQYYDLIALINRIVLTSRLRKYMALRPNFSSQPSQAPLQWLQYAGQAAHREIHARNQRRTWAHVMERRAQRIAYLELYRQKLTGADNLDAEELDRLEHALSYDDLILYRSLVKAHLQTRLRRESLESPKQAGWFSSWFGGKSTSTSIGTMLDEEDIKTMYESIAAQSLTPRPEQAEQVKNQVTVRVKTGLIAIAHEGADLSRLSLDGLEFILFNRVKSFRVEANLTALNVTSALVKDSQFPDILITKPTESNRHFIQLSYDSFSAHPDADSCFTFSMAKSSIVFDHQWVAHLKEFFFNQRTSEYLLSITSAAEKRLPSLARTKAALLHMVESRSSVDVRVEVEAPTLIVPEDSREQAGLAFVLDLGSLSAKSQLLPHTLKEELKNLSEQEIRQRIDVARLFYDHFKIVINKASLSHICCIHGRWSEAISGPDAVTIPSLDGQFEVGILRQAAAVPQAHLPKAKVTGLLGDVGLLFTDLKYQSFMRLIDIFFPDAPPQASTLDEDEFFDAIDTAAPVEDAETVNVAIELNIPSCSLHLGRQTLSSNVTLNQVQAKGLQVKIETRPMDVVVQVAIQAVEAQDLRKPEEVRTILSGRNGQVLQVRVQVLDEINPLRAAEAADILVSADLHALALHLDPPILFDILHYLRTTFPRSGRKMLRTKSAQDLLRRVSSQLVISEPPSRTDSPAPSTTSSMVSLTRVKVSVKANLVDLILCSPSGAVSSLALHNALIGGQIVVGGIMEFAGTLNDVELTDLASQKIVVRNEDGNSVKFDFLAKGQEGLRYDPTIALDVGSLLLQFIPSALCSLGGFWNSLLASLAWFGAQSGDTEPSTSITGINIRLNGPLIQFSTAETHLANPVGLKLGDLKLDSMNLDSPDWNYYLQMSDSAVLIGESSVMSGLNLNLAFIMREGKTKVHCQSSKLSASLTEREYAILYWFQGYFFQNLSLVAGAFLPPDQQDDEKASSFVVELPIDKIEVQLKGTEGQTLLAKLSLFECWLKMKNQSNGKSKLVFSAQNASIYDHRDGNLIRPEIISSVPNDRPLLSVLYESSPQAQTMTIGLDDLQMILAVDFILLLRRFFVDSLSFSQPQPSPPPNPVMLVTLYTVSSLRVFVIEDPHSKASEAVMISIPLAMVTQKENMTVCLKDSFVSFCDMDDVNATTLTFVEPFELILGIETVMAASDHGTMIPHYIYDFQLDHLISRCSMSDLTFLQRLTSQFSSGDSEPVSSPIFARYVYKLGMKAWSLIFIDDIDGIQLPLIDMEVSAISLVFDHLPSGMALSGGFEFGAAYYNDQNSSWEPLVEKALIQASSFNRDQSKEVVISSNNTIECVVSHKFCDTVIRLKRNLADMSEKTFTARQTVSDPFLLINRTGYDVVIWAEEREIDGNGSDCVKAEIGNGKELPWSFSDWRNLRRTMNQRSKLYAHLVESPWETIHDIGIDRTGTFHHRLRPTLGDEKPRYLIVDIRVKNGIKKVLLRPPILLRNKTHLPLQVSDSKGNTLAIESKGQAGFPLINSPQSLHLSQDVSLNVANLIGKREGETIRLGNGHVRVYYEEQGGLPSLLLGTITFQSPLIIHNKLPFDVSFHLVEGKSKRKCSIQVRSNEEEPIISLDTADFIFAHIEVRQRALGTRKAWMVSSPQWKEEEMNVIVFGSENTSTPLTLYHSVKPGGVRRIYLTSPYLIINQTNLELAIVPSPASKAAVITFCPAAIDQQALLPIPFGFVDSDRRVKQRVKIRAAQSDWSESVSFEAVGTDSRITLRGERDKSICYNLLVRVQLANSYDDSVYAITIGYQHVFLNKCESTVYLGPDRIPVQPNQSVGFHGPQALLAAVSVEVEGFEVNPHALFSIEELGNVYLVMRSSSCHEPNLFKVHKFMQQGSICSTISTSKHWPFEIRNYTPHVFGFFQNTSDQMSFVPAMEIANYAWERPSLTDKKLVFSIHKKEFSVDVHKLGRLGTVKFVDTSSGRKHRVSVSVTINGPMTIISLTSLDRPASPLSGKRISYGMGSDTPIEALDPDQRSFEMDDSMDAEHDPDDDVVQSMWRICFSGLGISLVDQTVEEILYMHLGDLEIRLGEGTRYITSGMTLRTLQVDNQLFDYEHPILLYPSLSARPRRSSGNAAEEPDNAVLNLGVIKLKNAAEGITHYKYAGVLLQEVTIELGEEILSRIIYFANFPSAQAPLHYDLLDPHLLQDTHIVDDESNMLYFDILQIHPIKINFSFSRTAAIKPPKDAASEAAGMYNPLAAVGNVFTMALGNVSDAPLKFNMLLLEHPTIARSLMYDLIYSHYSQQAMSQIHRLLGSADFFGNPVGLFSSFGSGVVDLFYEPYLGFVSDRPQDFGIGLARGGVSMVRKTVYGISDTFSKFTGSISKGFSAATFDSDFQRRRRISIARNRPKHAIRGITAGAQHLFSGIAAGVTGIVEKPVEGAKSGGVEGFFKGVGQGLVGIVTKPVVGVLDLATSINEDATVNLSQVRLPRAIPFDGVLRPYSAVDALGQALLRAVCEMSENAHSPLLALRSPSPLSRAASATVPTEYYVAHFEVSRERALLLVTTMRLIYVEAPKLFARASTPLPDDSNPSAPPSPLGSPVNTLTASSSLITGLKVLWTVGWEDFIQVKPNGEAVVLQIRQRHARQRIVPLADPISQEILCHRIDEALFQFNQKRSSLL